MKPLTRSMDADLLVEGVQCGVQRDLWSGCSAYGAILADPPWRFETWSAAGRDRCPDGRSRAAQRQNRPENHYPTMSMNELMALPVGELAAPDAMLFMWFVDPLLPQALELGRAWGFRYRTMAFTWAKLRNEGSGWGGLHEDHWHKLFPMGTGYFTRSNPEGCLLFTRGAPKRKSASVRQLIVARRREHSRKPDEARAGIEQLAHGPYLELFARETAPGWDAWGNQVGRFAAGSLAPTTPHLDDRDE